MNTRPEKTDSSFPDTRLWYALLVIPFLVYLKGLAPSVVLGDTGDFLTAGWIFGVSHPPGYPLYTMLVGIFEHLPIPPIWIQAGEFSAPAWRGNFLSMLMAVSALAALFALVCRITRRPIAAAIAVGALAFSRIFWWHAEIAENDALSSLFILLILLVAVKIVQDRKPGDHFILALLLGLAVSHHQSIFLFFPAIFIYLLVKKAIVFDLKKWALYALIFILGLTPFFYLPLVQYRTPEGPVHFVTESEYTELFNNEDSSENTGLYITTPPWKYFINYIGRTIYGHQRKYTHTDEALGEDVTTRSDVFMFYANLVLGDFGYLFVLLGLFGLVGGNRIRAPSQNGKNEINKSRISVSWLLLFAAFGIYFLVIMLVPSGDILRAPAYNLNTAGPGLMLPLEIIFAAFIGFGTSGILSYFENGRADGKPIKIALLLIGIAAMTWNAVSNSPYGDKSRNTLAHEYGLNVLDSCPADATLVVAGDELYAFWYLHNVHPDPVTGDPGYRPDINLTTWSGELENLGELADIDSAMASAVARLAEENPAEEINTTFFNSRFLNEPALQRYTLARRGIVFAFIPSGIHEGLIDSTERVEEQTGIAAYERGLPETYRWEYWGGEVIRDEIDPSLLPESGWWLWPPEADIQWRIGEMLLFYGIDSLERGQTEEAAGYFRQLILVEPENQDARDYLEYALSDHQARFEYSDRTPDPNYRPRPGKERNPVL